MSTSEDLSLQFKVLNVSVAPRILQRCEELCLVHSIPAEDFIDQWLAYAASNSHALAPSVDALDRMERTELQKQPKPQPVTPQSHRIIMETTPIHTPVRQNLQVEMTESPQRVESTPLSVLSESFSNRSDAGAAVHSFGESTDFKERCSRNLSIKIHNSSVKGKYMHEKFLAKRGCLDAMSAWVVGDICRRHSLELSKEKLKQYSGEMTICGRICSQTQGKLDESSIFCEGLLEPYRGQRVKLNLNKIKNVRLFPGQSVALSGNNTKDWFSVAEAFTVAPLPPSQAPNLEETVQIMVAAGPFTVPENLLYEPLEPLLNHVLESKPNILILMGPFLDAGHPHLDDLCESFDTFFESIIDRIMQRVPGGMSVVLVPSHKDAHNHVVFPSLPYSLKRSYDNLYLAPNPFMLDVEGVVIAGSTADVLFHLGKVEFAKGAFQDRIGQIVWHIFNQRSFYPLHPPNSELRVDYQLLEQRAMLEKAPHVMILPSNFRHFAKVMENCVIVNPERLTKGSGGGTFAKIEVRAGPKDNKVCERVSCSIIRV
ncbi:hypothetical protein Zmor_022427 [Zophobas morio]|uniref:DNA polymerase alpha subunit B n=1 Tax=Zophobas morio TaxID=2755281 RepID=A0AA38HWW7_9CUCU|nr:hypothetical protein Zmor_022427 [Zophobas morio]